MKKAQIIPVALSAAFICIMVGFFMGRSTSQSLHIGIGNVTVPTHNAGKLDLNTATVYQLQMLPGVGQVLAQNIVNYRHENGPFTSTDELLEVTGIGPKRLEEILEYITVGG